MLNAGVGVRANAQLSERFKTSTALFYDYEFDGVSDSSNAREGYTASEHFVTPSLKFLAKQGHNRGFSGGLNAECLF